VLLIAAALRLPSRSLNTPSRFASIKRLTVLFIMSFTPSNQLGSEPGCPIHLCAR